MPTHDTLPTAGGPQAAPTVETLAQMKRERISLGIDPMREVPDAYAATRYAKELGQEDWRGRFTTGFTDSYMWTVGRKLKDEGFPGLFGFREAGTPYNRDKARAAMPSHYTRDQIESLLDEDTAESLARAMRRLDDELAVGARIANQYSGAWLPTLIGQMIDVDLPLLLVTGGAIKATGVARSTYRTSRTMGLSETASLRMAGTASGANVGAQVGITLAAAELTQRETANWQDAAFMFLGTSAFGTVLGGVGKMNSHLVKTGKLAKEELAKRIITDDPNVNGDLNVEVLTRDGDIIPEPGILSGETATVNATLDALNTPPGTAAAGSRAEPVRPPAFRTDFSTDPARHQGESSAAVIVGGKTFIGGAHIDALDKAIAHFGASSPEMKAFEEAADPFAAIGHLEAGKFTAQVAPEKLPGDGFKLDNSKVLNARAKIAREADDGTTVIGGQKAGGVGATTVGGGPQGVPRAVINDPHGPLTKDQEAFLRQAHGWAHDSDFDWKRSRDAMSMWTKVLTSNIGSFGMRTITDMYTSKSKGMNWLGGVVFESASGLNRGRATASALMENYHRVIQTHIGRHIDPLMHSWAKQTDMTFGNSGYGISDAGKRAFHRELQLEMNARLHKRASNPGAEIKEAADRYDIAGAVSSGIGKGKRGQRALDGAENWEPRSGWTPMRWAGQEIERLLTLGIRMVDLESAIAQGYRSAGMAGTKDALIVAKAVLNRARQRVENMDDSTATLLTGDGREFMAATLRLNNVSEREIERIMERLVGNLEERSRPGFTKSRNDIDMEIAIPNSQGLDLKIVDLLDQDMHRSWQRYTRQLSGAAALARVGITNQAQRKVVIESIRAEQRSLGEIPVEADKLQAMFSHFNGGPVYGFANGVTNKGLEPVIALSKRITNLGLLEKLGVTQLGESLVTIAQVGMVNWYRRGPLALWDKQMRAANDALRKEVAYVVGDIGWDERYYAEWLDLDDISMQDRSAWIKKVSAISSNASFVQAYTSAFNTVRKYQQRVAVLGMVDKVMRTVRSGDTADLLRRFEDDFGLGIEEINEFERMISNGTIEFDPTHGYVNRLNIDQWDPDLADTFGAAMVRNMNQVVQKSMAGEQDAWMHTGWGSMMTHLKTFPMAAFQKQFMRNARHMDMQAVSYALTGMSSAFIAIHVRDALDGRDRSTWDRAKAAFDYNNMTSWMGTAWDPTMSMMGFDDLRLNPYGQHASLVPPVITQLNSLMRAPGAIPKWLTGNADYYDLQAVKTLPFAGSYIFSRLFTKQAQDWINNGGSHTKPIDVPKENRAAEQARLEKKTGVKFDGSLKNTLTLLEAGGYFGKVEARVSQRPSAARIAHDAKRPSHDATVDQVFKDLLQ